MIYLFKLSQTLINKETDNDFKTIGLIIISCLILLFGLLLKNVVYYNKPNNNNIEPIQTKLNLRIVK